MYWGIMNSDRLEAILNDFLSRHKQTTAENRPRVYGTRVRFLIILGLIGLFILFVFLAYRFLPVHENANPPLTWGFSVDWKGCIRPDTLTLLKGESPYQKGCGLNPPWTYILLTPIALLPPDLGAAVMFTVTYFGYALIAFRLHYKPWAAAIFLLTPFVFSNAVVGNIDWLAAIGFVLPPPIGLFFVLMKPQIGAGIALFWAASAWKKGGWRQLMLTFVPVITGYLISFIIYGFWPQNLFDMPHDAYNAAIFPLGIPIAIGLLYFSIRNNKAHSAMAAGPFLAPYVNFSSYAVTLLAFDFNFVTGAVLLALLWIVH